MVTIKKIKYFLDQRHESECWWGAEEVVCRSERAMELHEPLSILGMRGLGAEHWKGINPVSHVDAERESWDS